MVVLAMGFGYGCRGGYGFWRGIGVAAEVSMRALCVMLEC